MIIIFAGKALKTFVRVVCRIFETFFSTKELGNETGVNHARYLLHVADARLSISRYTVTLDHAEY